MAQQNFLTNAAGKLFTNNTLSKKLRSVAQPIMRWRQFTTKDPQFGKHQGEILLFDKVTNLDHSPTDGAIIPEGENIPRARFKVLQGQCQALPSGRATGFTEELESFSEFSVRDPIESRLGDHMAKALNYRAYAKFLANNVGYTPTGTTDVPSEDWFVDGSVDTAATRDLMVYDIKNIVDAMDSGDYGGSPSAPVPPYDGINLQGIFSVAACRAIMDDPEWEKASWYGDPERQFDGEVGRIYRLRVVRDNHILSTIGGFKGGAVIFGKDAVMECLVTPEEVRVGIPGDFGRDMAMAWYYLGGFATTWQYNGTAGDTQELDNRIVRVAST